MALFVVALAIVLSSWRASAATADEADVPRGSIVVVIAVLVAASFFAYSLPGLAWFGLAIPIWLVLEALAGRSPIDFAGVRETIAGHRAAAVAIAIALVALAAAAIVSATDFIERIDDVQASAGRLSSPVFPGEVFGIWPEGDFRIVRTEVAGAIPAALLGALAAGIGVYALIPRRDLAFLAVLVAGGLIYIVARPLAEIHVEAKALAIMAPLVLLVALRALLSPERDWLPASLPRAAGVGLYALGALVAIAATASTLLALRAAPVGFDDRAEGLEELGERIQGESVIFLGVDRFAAYRLRGTLVRAPAGYVPPEIDSRPEKVWQQGFPADFDTVEPRKLDKFDYAITTAAAYQSEPPSNFERVAEAGDYVLWERHGETPRIRVLDEGGDPGAPLSCTGGSGARFAERPGRATLLLSPAVVESADWPIPARVDDAAGGQEAAFAAPAMASAEVTLSDGGRAALSLQYHSQVPLEILVDGEPVAELPPTLDGMYLDGAGRGAFWPAGEVATTSGSTTIEVRAAEPSDLQDALGVERRVWLGDLALSAVGEPTTASIQSVCDSIGRPVVDHLTLAEPGKASR